MKKVTIFAAIFCIFLTFSCDKGVTDQLNLNNEFKESLLKDENLDLIINHLDKYSSPEMVRDLNIKKEDETNIDRLFKRVKTKEDFLLAAKNISGNPKLFYEITTDFNEKINKFILESPMMQSEKLSMENKMQIFGEAFKLKKEERIENQMKYLKIRDCGGACNMGYQQGRSSCWDSATSSAVAWGAGAASGGGPVVAGVGIVSTLYFLNRCYSNELSRLGTCFDACK